MTICIFLFWEKKCSYEKMLDICRILETESLPNTFMDVVKKDGIVKPKRFPMLI